MTRIRKRIIRLALALCIISLSACQPTPEERLNKAEEYIASAEYRSAAIELQNLLQAAPDNAQARLLLAQTAYQLGDFSQATSQFERAIGLGESSVSTWIAYGRTLLSQGRAMDALEQVTPNLDAMVDNVAVLEFLGDVQFSLKSLDDAEKYYSKAVEISPTSVGGLIGQAMVKASRGDHAEAQQLLDTATQHNPDASSVWLARGQILEANRNFAEAALAFENALRLQTARTPLAEEFSSRVSLVSTLIDSRQFDAAESSLIELKTRLPDHPVADFLQGRLAFAQGDYDNAQMALQDYLSKNAGDVRGRAILGAINFSQDNLRQAESHLIAAVRANAGGEATRRLLAETRLRLNNPGGALDVLLSPDSLDQTDALYLSMLGRAELAAGDDEAALEYFRKGVEQEPGNDALTLALASTYLRVDRAAQAVDVLDNMPMRVGSDLRRQTLLIAALVRQGDNERAIAESNRLLEANPDDPSVHVIAGALWQSIGAPERATMEYERALTIDPTNLAAQFSLSRIALSEGKTTAAALRLESLLESHPAYVPAIVALGMIFQDNGSLDSLRPYVRRAMENAPESVTPHMILARLELTLGRPDAVIAAVDTAQTRFGGNADLDHFRGLALLAKGEYQSALRALMTAASASPGNAAFQFDLAQAQLANDYLDAASESAEVYCGLMEADIRCPMLRGDIALARGDSASAVRYFEAASRQSWNRQVVTRLARAKSVAGDADASQPLATWLVENPDDHAARSLYARILESQGDTPAAIIEFEKLLANDELDVVGMNNLAWQYAMRGDDRAVELARQAHALAPENGSVTDTLGWILSEKGNFAEAVPLLREAVQRLPDNAEVRFHLASALIGVGAKDEAKKILEGLLSSGQAFPSRSEAERISSSL